jgi:16S rRNA (cytosine967-C5)-methyltransferase
VLPEENEAIVEGFLASHPAFAPLDVAAELARANIPLDPGSMLKLAPDTHGCDGFFAVAMERRTRPDCA